MVKTRWARYGWLLAASVLALVAACGKGPAKGGPVTFTTLDFNGEKEWGTDEISKEITNQTGVSLDYLPVGNSGSEKLIILLASGDIPDLIAESLFSVTESKYVAAGAVLQLDDLVAKHGPDIKKEVGDDYLNLMRTQHDGKLYALPNWYQKPIAQSANGALMIRKDLLAEFEPAKAQGEGYFTFDEFSNLLGRVKAKYPQMVGFAPVGGELEWWVMWTFRGFMGIQNYSVQGDQVKFYFRDPKMLEAYKYLNGLVRKGYADPEWATLNWQTFNQKAAQGTVFSMVGSYWNAMEPSAALMQEGKGQFLPYKLVGPGADPAHLPLGGTNMLGWGGIMVGKNVKDPVRMMQFLNFMASEKGQLLAWFGIQGKHWDMVGGKVTPKPDVLQAYKAGGDTWGVLNTAVGFGKWDWMVRSTSPSRPITIPGYIAETEAKSELDAMASKTLGDTAYAQDIFIGIEPDPNTPEDLITQRVKDIWLQASTAIINAKTDAQMMDLYNKMMKDLEDAGVAQVEKILTEKFNKRKAAFGWKD